MPVAAVRPGPNRNRGMGTRWQPGWERWLMTEGALAKALQQRDAATAATLNGDPRLYIDSRAVPEDITVFGAWVPSRVTLFQPGGCALEWAICVPYLTLAPDGPQAPIRQQNPGLEATADC